MKYVTLDADSLSSKFGFCDGDVLDDWRYSLGDDMVRGLVAKPGTKTASLGFEHALLSNLVREHLLPALPHAVEVYDICSCHNPIRAEAGEANVFDVEVVVSFEQITLLAKALIADEMEPA